MFALEQAVKFWNVREPIPSRAAPTTAVMHAAEATTHVAVTQPLLKAAIAQSPAIDVIIPTHQAPSFIWFKNVKIPKPSPISTTPKISVNDPIILSNST